jgi:hypothetical protein
MERPRWRLELQSFVPDAYVVAELFDDDAGKSASRVTARICPTNPEEGTLLVASNCE